MHQNIIWKNFPENCIKRKKFEPKDFGVVICRFLMKTEFLQSLLIIAGSFRVSLFIDFGSPSDLGTGPWHFYDK